MNKELAKVYDQQSTLQPPTCSTWHEYQVAYRHSIWQSKESERSGASFYPMMMMFDGGGDMNGGNCRACPRPHAHMDGRVKLLVAMCAVPFNIDFPSGCRTSAVGSHGSPQSGVVRLVSCISGVLKTLESQRAAVRFCWNSPFGTRKL